MGVPVEISAVHDAAAHGQGVAVHIFGGGVGHDIGPPLKGTAVDGRGEGIVHDQRNSVLMGQTGKFFNIQDHQGRVGDGFPEHCLCVWAERLLDLLLRRVRIHQSHVDALFLHGHCKQVGGAAVNGSGAYNMIPGAADIKNGKVIGSLAGGGQHGSHASLQLADFLCHCVVGGVGQSRIKISVLLQIEQTAHLLAAGIFKCSALVNGQHSGLSVAGIPASLDADRFRMMISLFHDVCPPGA